MNAANSIRALLESYLAHRRHAGFALRIEGQQLERFVRFAEQAEHRGPLTLELAIRWACASHHHSPLTAARRIEVLRPFARYCQRFDPGTEVPPLRLFGRGHRRLTPHIYTDTEIRALLAATETLHPQGGLRGACCQAILGLIAATGLRVSEATGLERADVDLPKAILLIRQAKFGKTRWVPLHPTTVDALQRYAHLRDCDPRSTRISAFFVGDYGRPAQANGVQYAFRLLRHALRWKPRGGHRAPRIQDLRHTFVCRTLQRWYETDVDIDRNILALSTYIGHAKVTDTYWYVTATPELMALAAQRFEDFSRRGQS